MRPSVPVRLSGVGGVPVHAGRPAGRERRQRGESLGVAGRSAALRTGCWPLPAGRAAVPAGPGTPAGPADPALAFAAFRLRIGGRAVSLLRITARGRAVARLATIRPGLAAPPP